MNSVPLIQNVDKDSINTTIIALKKAINEIESVLGLDSGSDIDTSVFVKKSEVVDAVEADNLNPVTSNAVADYTVDRIEVNNSQPVSSNAVANMNYAQKKYLSINATNLDDFINQLFNYCCNNQDKSLINGDWSGHLFYNAYAQTILGVYTMVLLFTDTSQGWFLWGQGSLQGSKAL